jgi:hypothetical protein
MIKTYKYFPFLFIFFLLFTLSGCDDFPQFEGWYIGTVTVEYQTDAEFPETSEMYLELTRNFKDIEILYHFTFSRLTMNGTITAYGKPVITKEVGFIDYPTGNYTSQLIQTVDGVTILIMKLELRKSFVDF